MENQKQVSHHFPPALEIAFAIPTFPLPRTRFIIHRKENPEQTTPSGSFFDEKTLGGMITTLSYVRPGSRQYLARLTAGKAHSSAFTQKVAAVFASPGLALLCWHEAGLGADLCKVTSSLVLIPALLKFIAQGALGDDSGTVDLRRSWRPFAENVYSGLGAWDFARRQPRSPEVRWLDNSTILWAMNKTYFFCFRQASPATPVIPRVDRKAEPGSGVVLFATASETMAAVLS